MPTARPEQLFEYALRHVAPFASQTGHAWAAIPVSPFAHEAWPIVTQRFRDWLAYTFYTEHSLFPERRALSQAIRMLQALTRSSDAPPREVLTRIGGTGDPLRPESLLLDLATPDREIVEITPRGWTIRDDLGSTFHAIGGALPLPIPTPGPATPLEQLRRLLPTQSTLALHRILTWLFSALHPAGPYPIPILTGPPACGKTTIARILRSLIDPHVSPIEVLPNTQQKLLRLALHNRVLVFDHVSRLNQEMSTALPRLAAGTGFSEGGVTLLDQLEHFPIARPVILTVPQPETIAERWRQNRTLMSFAATVHLQAIPMNQMRTEQELGEQVNALRPSILASLCDAAATSLAATEHNACSTSRFAGAFHWTAPAAGVLGLSIEDVNGAFSADPVIAAIAELLDDRGEWSGSPSQLFQLLPGHAADPASFSRLLNTLPLAIFGIHHESYAAHEGRIIRLSATRRLKIASRNDKVLTARSIESKT